MQSGDFLNADEVLSRYKDWKDTTAWPVSSRILGSKINKGGKVKNLREKGGIVGAFCRTYSINEAIENFLQHVYSKCIYENRYTYILGSSYGGLVLYENGDLAYSHHGTDPAGGRLLNSFDLVRIHLFGHLDKDIPKDCKILKLPSYKEMIDFCSKDNGVKTTIGKEKLTECVDDFGVSCAQLHNMWITNLDLDKNGGYKNTIGNVITILENDNKIKGRIAHNEFSNRTMILDDLPMNSKDKWYGVNYQAYKEVVRDAISNFINEGVYPKNLWELK